MKKVTLRETFSDEIQICCFFCCGRDIRFDLLWPRFLLQSHAHSWEPDIPFPVEGHVSCSGILDIVVDSEDQGKLFALEGMLNEDLPEGTQGVPAYVRYNKHWLGTGEEVGVVVPCFVFGWEESRKVTILRFGFVETLGIHHKDSSPK